MEAVPRPEGKHTPFQRGTMKREKEQRRKVPHMADYMADYMFFSIFFSSSTSGSLRQKHGFDENAGTWLA